MQILKDIYLTSGLPYGFHPNAYAVKGPRGVVLIDCGLDERDLATIDATLRYWDLSALPITHLLITHAHFDHTGNAQALRGRGILTAAGPGDAEGIEQGDERTIPYAYGRAFPACGIDIRVTDGDIIDAAGLRFEVIHVPGHSTGCVIYKLVHEGRIILFTGDVAHVGETSDTARLGWNGAVDYDPAVYLQSLQRISRLAADLILAGHYQPCLQDGYKVLQNAYMRGLMELR